MSVENKSYVPGEQDASAEAGSNERLENGFHFGTPAEMGAQEKHWADETASGLIGMKAGMLIQAVAGDNSEREAALKAEIAKELEHQPKEVAERVRGHIKEMINGILEQVESGLFSDDSVS